MEISGKRTNIEVIKKGQESLILDTKLGGNDG